MSCDLRQQAALVISVVPSTLVYLANVVFGTGPYHAPLDGMPTRFVSKIKTADIMSDLPNAIRTASDGKVALQSAHPEDD